MNQPIFEHYVSGVTQRRLAKLLRINRKTVAAKVLLLSQWARNAHSRALEAKKGTLTALQFDEMESFEHTRLKPLSIALAVEANSGNIIDVKVAPMAYKGRFAVLAFKKYGLREDKSGEACARVLLTVKNVTASNATITTDLKQQYKPLIRELLPRVTHLAVQREKVSLAQRLFKNGRRNVKDPLFVLNFTAAKIRHDLSRMARKVWVTTKKKEYLEAHLNLYIAYHNQYKIMA